MARLPLGFPAPFSFKRRRAALLTRTPVMRLKFILPLALATLLFGPAAAQDKPVLTIYTYDAFAAEWGPAGPLKTGFEETCECTVNFVSADSSIGALRKVQLEGAGTRADIVLGLDTSVVGEARATGLFADHGVNTSDLSVPNDWSAPDFVPFDYGYLAMIYNRELMPAPPASFQELAAPERDLRIIVQDPRSSTPGKGLVLWIRAAYGDDASETWARIAPRIITLTRGWSEAYSLFLQGEADMVLSYTTSPAYHLIAEGDGRFAAASFSEGHYTQIEVAGILKSSANRQLASRFLSYLISPPAQEILITTNWMYPVRDIPLPEGFSSLVMPQKTLLLDDETVFANSTGWIGEMLNAFE